MRSFEKVILTLSTIGMIWFLTVEIFLPIWGMVAAVFLLVLLLCVSLTKRWRFLRHYGYALYLVFFTFFSAEILCRGLLYWQEQKIGELKDLSSFRDPPPGPKAYVSLRKLIWLAENPRLIYELVPGLDVIFKGTPTTTTAEGFRTTRYSCEEACDKTIIGLGDSIMFGWKVRDEETYLSQLARKLNNSDSSWQIINLAVPGYNTVMEVESLKEKGLSYHPDIVVIEYVQNDFDLPNFIRGTDSISLFDVNESYLYDVIFRGASRNYQVKLAGAPVCQSAPLLKFENDPQKVSEQYRHLIGINAYRRAMQDLRSLQDEYGFKTVLITFAQTPPEIRTVCEDLSIPYFSVVESDKVKNFLDENSIETKALSIPDDGHHSVLGHRCVAQALTHFINANP
ncbi:GDSL-type esterase/lipase family protein [Acidobacteriota bacterium]